MKKTQDHVEHLSLIHIYTIESYVQNAKDQVSMGASAIHVEDMAGLMTPKAAYDLIRALKKELTVPIHLHAHCVGGLADMAYWEARCV